MVCCGNIADELESGYFDREYSLTKPYAGAAPPQPAHLSLGKLSVDDSFAPLALQARTGTWAG